MLCVASAIKRSRIQAAATGAAAERSRFTTIISLSRIPRVGVHATAKTRSSFDFPYQASDVVFGAGPRCGCNAERGASGKRRAIVGNLGEIETCCSGTEFAQRTDGGLYVTTIACVLSWVSASVTTDGCAARCGYVNRVVAGRLAGIVEARRMDCWDK